MDGITPKQTSASASKDSLRQKLTSKAKKAFGSIRRSVAKEPKAAIGKSKSLSTEPKKRTTLKNRSKQWIARHGKINTAVHTLGGAVGGGASGAAGAGLAGGVIGAAAGGGIGAVAAVPAALVGGVLGAAAGAVAGFAAGRKATKDSLKLAQANIQNSRGEEDVDITSKRQDFAHSAQNDKKLTTIYRLTAEYATNELIAKIPEPEDDYYLKSYPEYIVSAIEKMSVQDCTTKDFRNAVLIANFLAIPDNDGNGQDEYLYTIKKNLGSKTLKIIEAAIYKNTNS